MTPLVRTGFALSLAAGVRVDAGNEVARDPGEIVIEALRALGPDAKAPQIRAWIENLHGFVSR